MQYQTEDYTQKDNAVENQRDDYRQNNTAVQHQSEDYTQKDTMQWSIRGKSTSRRTECSGAFVKG